MRSDTASIDDLAQQAEDADKDEIFNVDVGEFDGPLHLLLDLARRQKIDLRQISILKLANQYLDFVKSQARKRIDLAADYLLMAAWLALLKSKLLLPAPEKDNTDEPDADQLADALAFRLRRLDAMRKAADALQSGPVLDNVVFLRGAPEQPKVVRHREFDTTLWHMTQAFGAIRTRKIDAEPHVIAQQFVLPLEAARDELRGLLDDFEDWTAFRQIQDLVGAAMAGLPPRSISASLFSASLELARDGDADLRQYEAFAPLYMRAASSVREEDIDELAQA